ncbi:MAG: hypothetical protein ACI9YH_000035 [Colwellia sp.]|jgi:hypothetical protein
MGESSGVLACMASDKTILVIPSDVSDLEQTTNNRINYLDMNGHTWFTRYRRKSITSDEKLTEGVM